MNCLRVRQELKAYIDGELRPWTRWLVTCHITSCKDCRREMEEMTELTNKVQHAPAMSAPEELRGKVLSGLTFQPASDPARTAWQRYAGPAAALGAVMVIAAVIFPVMMRSKGAAVRPQHGAAPPPVLESAPMPAAAPPVAKHPMREPQAEQPASAPASAVSLMIIKTAEISVQVKDFQQANDQAVSIAKTSGGYVTDTSAASDRGVPTSGSLTMRVPVESFERTLNRLAKLGRVTSRSINGQDVTGEAVDLASRLRNLRAEERQYLEIMNRAKRIPDIVTVTNELSRVRGEIEEAQGRLSYLKSAAAMSTINLVLGEKQKPKPRQHGSALGTTLGNAVSSLGATLSGLASILIWLVVYSPFWAVPIALWFYYRRRNPVVQQQ